MAQKQNKDILDVTKFVLSILIVMIHTNFLGPYHPLIFPTVRLAVPIFFILSGYFAFLRLGKESDGSARRMLLKKILRRYLQLYLFWLVVLLPHTLHIRQYFSQGLVSGILKFIQSFLLDSTFRGSWYLMASIIGIAVVFFLSEKFSDKALLFITIPFYLLATLLSEFGGYIASVPRLYHGYRLFTSIFGIPCFNFTIALLYIVIGKMLAASDRKHYSNGFYIVGFLISYGLLLSEHHLLSTTTWFIRECDGLLLLAPTAVFAISYLLNKQVTVSCAPRLRAMSTIVYCTHIPIFGVVSTLAGMLHLSDPLYLIQFFATYAMALIVSVVILKLEQVKIHPLFKLFKYAH